CSPQAWSTQTFRSAATSTRKPWASGHRSCWAKGNAYSCRLAAKGIRVGRSADVGSESCRREPAQVRHITVKGNGCQAPDCVARNARGDRFCAPPGVRGGFGFCGATRVRGGFGFCGATRVRGGFGLCCATRVRGGFDFCVATRVRGGFGFC